MVLSKLKIKGIRKVNRKTVHDISVNDEHHYILEGGIVSHNSGLKYAASTIAMLSKRKEKDGNEVIGNIIHVKMWKSRLSRENKMVDVLLTYDKGLDRYYGLLDMAERYGVIKKVSTRYEMPDGSKHFGKTIYQEPEKFFTKEILDAINDGVKKEFSYGSSVDTSESEVEFLTENVKED